MSSDIPAVEAFEHLLLTGPRALRHAHELAALMNELAEHVKDANSYDPHYNSEGQVLQEIIKQCKALVTEAGFPPPWTPSELRRLTEAASLPMKASIPYEEGVAFIRRRMGRAHYTFPPRLRRDDLLDSGPQNDGQSPPTPDSTRSGSEATDWPDTL